MPRSPGGKVLSTKIRCSGGTVAIINPEGASSPIVPFYSDYKKTVAGAGPEFCQPSGGELTSWSSGRYSPVIPVFRFRVSNSRGLMSGSAKSGFSKPAPANPELGTEDLLVKVAGRDVEALESLYDQFAPSLMGILVRILSSKPDAESALQAVFLRLWKEAPELARAKGSVAVWLMLTARQAGLERLRAQRAGVAGLAISRGQQGKKKRETATDRHVASTIDWRRSGEQPPAERELHSGFFLASPQTWLPRPEDIAWAEAHLNLLQRAFDQMPKPQRRALELAVFEAYNEAEIAAQLGEPLGKVSAGLRAAFTFLRHRQHAVLGTWTADI
jgi:RNA polymerase sigma factor (sigma-70 family)